MIAELLLASQLVLVEKKSDELIFACSKAELTEVLRYHYPEPAKADDSHLISWGTSISYPSQAECRETIRFSGSTQDLPMEDADTLESMGKCFLRVAESQRKKEAEVKRISALARKCLGDK